MSVTYLKWSAGHNPRYGCVLDKLIGLKKLRPLWRGESISDTFPSDAEFPMSPNFPDNTVLTDHLNNRNHLIVASDGLVKFFQEQQYQSEFEYLPVAIRDHKGKITAKYTIVHPLAALECLDDEASGASLVPDSDTVIDVDQIVVKESRLDPSRILFRVARFPEGLLIRSDTAAAITQAGFSGIAFAEIRTS